MDLAPGTMVTDNVRLVSVLGEGGMGSVWVADHLSLHTRVAVKFMSAALIREDVGRDPAQIRARLQQSADDLGQPGTDPYYGKGRINAGNAVGAN